MIPRAAVRTFLARPRDDLRRYKELSDAALRRAARALPVKPPVWKKLLRDQRVLFIIGAIYRRAAFWADTGIGKTLLSMALARYFRRAGVARRFLVLVPGNINLAEWESERDLHCPRTSMAVLPSSTREKWRIVREGLHLLTVTTYGGLVRMACTKIAHAKLTRGKHVSVLHLPRRTRINKKEIVVPAYEAAGGCTAKLRMRDLRGWVRNKDGTVSVTHGGTLSWVFSLKLSKKNVDELCQTFDGVILDESSSDQAVQYHDSLAFRVCRWLSKKMRSQDLPFFELSGTPFGRDPTPLWAQMYLVDGGESLGPTLGLFRAAFFKEEENYFGGPDYEFREKMSPTLHRLLAHRSVTVEADEASLPPVVPRTREIVLPREAAEYCEVAKEAILAARGNYQETKNAFLRMRQISSGFLGYTDDETGARAKFAFDENPKLESLISRIRSVAGKYKVVVFHEFIYSGDRIAAELDKLKIGYARAGSGTKSRVKEERLRFTRDDDCRVFILSNRMAQGPNLQIAKYAEFYETPVDPKARKQARRRVERQHSMHDRVFVTDYVVRGTYDRRVLDHLAEGKDLFDAIIRGRETA